MPDDLLDEVRPESAPAGGSEGTAPASPRPLRALRVREARAGLAVGTMERLGEAQSELNDAPRKVLGNVKETIATASVVGAASREQASSAMHQAAASRQLNATLEHAYKEVAESVIGLVHGLRHAPAQKSRFEIFMDAGERLFTKVTEKAIDVGGPVLVEAMAKKFGLQLEGPQRPAVAVGAASGTSGAAPPASAAPAPATPPAAAPGAAAPAGAPAPAGGGDAEGAPEDLLQRLYTALPEAARAAMTFEAFRESMLAAK